MKFIRTDIPEVVLCEHTVYTDNRGCFLECFREDVLNAFLEDSLHFTQMNQSISQYGVLRGLHFQKPPYAQSKWIHVISGSIWDVALDIRPDSPTFGLSVSMHLSPNQSLFIPKGFAHGFLVLSPDAKLTYLVDADYFPEFEQGIHYQDPSLNIAWPLPDTDIILSDKDRMLTSFETLKSTLVSSP